MQFTPTLLEGIIFVLGSVISGIIGFALQVYMPDDVRFRTIYRLKSWRKRRNDNPVTTSLTTKYELEQPVPLSEIADDLSSNLSSVVSDESRIVDKTSSADGDEHSIKIETSRADLEMSVHVTAPPGGTAPGDPRSSATEERIARSMSVTAEISTQYTNLRWALELAAQYTDDFGSAIPVSLDNSSNYNVTCHLNSPTVIEDFLAKLSADQVTAENESVEVQFDEEMVRVRNISVGDRPDIFEKLQELVIFYG